MPRFANVCIDECVYWWFKGQNCLQHCVLRTGFFLCWGLRVPLLVNSDHQTNTLSLWQSHYFDSQSHPNDQYEVREANVIALHSLKKFYSFGYLTQPATHNTSRTLTCVRSPEGPNPRRYYFGHTCAFIKYIVREFNSTNCCVCVSWDGLAPLQNSWTCLLFLCACLGKLV